jgi:hypothetical protein
MVTTYIILTIILFCINLLVSLFLIAMAERTGFPTSEFIAIIFNIIFIVWGITILIH